MTELEGVRAKLDRGTEHLRELDREMRAFFASNPYRIVEELDPDPRYEGWYLARFEILREPPIELAVMAGEIFYQFRSALDHLWTRVLALDGKATGNFPIYDPGIFWRVGRDGRSPAETLKPLIRNEHFALVERLQMPENHKPRRGVMSTRRVLLVMHWFWNRDKHEIVRPAFFSTRHMGMAHHPAIADFQLLISPVEDLDARTEVYRVKFVSKEKVEVPFRLEPDLSFGDTKYPWLTLETIRICARRTRWIVKRIVELTPEFLA